MGKNYLVYFIMFSVSLSSWGLYAQTAPSIAIHGAVTDVQGEPLAGVNVEEVSTGNGTITDLDGQYRMSVAFGAKVRFSYLGYKPVEISVDSRSVYNITMTEDVSALDEVVVVAYGTQRKKEITGAISVVDTRAIEKQLAPGIGQALQGLAAGVSVTTSGRPGSDADILIRGIGSFNNSSPLYVIDGMILEGSQRQFNMNDVESVQVLKDASATALYGSRGANGVILITTKHGSEGQTKIQFAGTLGISQIARRYEMMNSIAFLRVNRMAYENAGKVWPGEPAQGQVLVNTDWQDAFFKTGLTKDYNLNVSGGNTNGRYMLSFDLYNEDGVVIGPFHDRMTIRSNTEAKKGIFTIGENLMIGRSETKTLQGSPFIDLARMPPVIPVYDPENQGGYGYGSAAYQTYGTNPVGLQETRDYRQYNLRIIGNAFVQLEPVKGLQLKSSLGVEYFNWFDKYKTTYKQLRYLTSSQYEDQLTEGNGDMQSWQWENTAFYKNSIGDHKFDVLLGYTSQQQARRSNSVSGYNMLAEDFWVLDQSSPSEPFDASGSDNAISMTSVIGRVNYNYAERYLLQLNMRRDASSLFGKNYQAGVFPGISFGWRINEEAFMKPVHWINDLKLRLSYGKSGNQQAISPYQFAAYIVSGDRVGIFGEPSNVYPGMIQNGLANPDLRWETRGTFNVGLDFALLDQKFYGSFEFFDARLNDLLIRKELSWTTGTDVYPWMNYGKINNKGLELQAGYRETKNDFKYDVTLNLSGTRNKVLALDGDDFYFAGLNDASYTALGHSMGEFYVYRTDGIFQNWDEIYAHSATIVNETTGQEETVMIQPNAAPGDIRYKDLNHDGKLSEDDRELIGSPFPKLDGGLTFSCEYRNFDFNLFFYGVYGNLIYNNAKFWMERMDETTNLPERLKPWTGEGTSYTTPRPFIGQTDNVIGYSDRWIEKGDYIRLKNIQIGYTVPSHILKSTRVIERLRIYAGAQNLFTLTGYSGLDPEISGGGLFSKGYDDGHFPPVRTFICGLQVSF
ncbi:MAG: TonB-dependent receptor [Dysgonamonadaceae bacterium]|jgi:TonB-linked SusC/RagA family outer membrane protein|nr:TonB-dependent receptor [Dysgonamonadaceae bacterium]